MILQSILCSFGVCGVVFTRCHETECAEHDLKQIIDRLNFFFSFNISVCKRCPQTSRKSLIAHPHNCNINVCLTIKVIDGVYGDLSAVKSAVF